MLFVASEKGGLIKCPGGPHKMADGTPAVRAMTWKEVEEICAELNQLNPYDPKLVGEILKIEDCNYDRASNQHQLYGLAVSAKRYVVYERKKDGIEIIKPSENGLGIVFVPDKRKRYKAEDCKDQETDYPRWIVEAWARLLDDHFRKIKDPEDALVTRELWFANFPAVMRIRVTTPNVLKALRKRDPGAAKPYNFALSPILIQPPQDCTLVAPFSKHPEKWLTQPYTEVHSGETVNLLGEYRGRKLLPQRLSNILWRHFLHPEDKSLSPDGERCGPYTKGLLLRRPIRVPARKPHPRGRAVLPFHFIGKEIERKAQEGEDISALESTGPIRYEQGQTAKTRAADPALILRAKRFPERQLMRESHVSQHPVERFLSGARVHPSTRTGLMQAVERLERETIRRKRSAPQ